MRPSFDAIAARAMLLARGLVYVFLIYFLPVVVRDLVGAAFSGSGLLGLLTGVGSRPAIALLFTVVTLALSIGFVLVHARSDPESSLPRPLLRFDRPFAKRWALGFGAGIGVIAAVHAGLVLAGVVRIESVSRTALDRPFLAFAIFAALLAESLREELAFRGPAQRDLARVVGFPLAALALSGTFTALHLANPNAEPASLLGVFLAGLALAGVVRAEGDLALASGLHAGWNVALGMIVSVPVSGIRLGARLLETEVAGDSTWSGGGFGFESSVPGIALLFVAGYFAWRWKGRGNT